MVKAYKHGASAMERLREQNGLNTETSKQAESEAADRRPAYCPPPFSLSVVHGVRSLQPWALAVCIALLAGCGEKEPPGVALTVTTLPEDGANIKFMDEPIGVSPVTIPNVKPGPVLVEAELDGYKSEWDTVRVQESPAEQTVTLQLRKLEGTVTFESTPSRATVRLQDGTVLGETPLVNTKIPAGIHTFEIELENYIPEEITFEVEADFVYTKTQQLNPKNGVLRIFTIPTGAALWINNRKQTDQTPVTLDLTPGMYRIGVHTPGFLMSEQVVELTANENESVEFKLVEGAVPEGMVLVPAGEFTMGMDKESPDERPARTVMVEAYYIDKYEVTNEQYKRVVSSHVFKKGDENVPISGVSWEEATAYAKAVGKRLPTEAEWEKAARGEDGRSWPWGNSFDARNCSHASGPGARLRDIGSFPGGISPYGCFDMAGNVREWTQSWYQVYPGNDVVTADYGQVYRVLRGGSYLSGAFDVRTVRRSFERMDVAEPDFGFRCAADVGG